MSYHSDKYGNYEVWKRVNEKYGPKAEKGNSSMNTTKQQSWQEQAMHAIAQGQSENDFIAHCHPDSRRMALKAYREARGYFNHMEACRSLLNVPSDEVLYQSILALKESHNELLEFVQAIARSACLNQQAGKECICFSCYANRLLAKAEESFTTKTSG